ncbi:hypothetical protein PILCRDRAFT_819586 [Piloderma croceum F 1598]|uniref:F-box domain-containing protein n=1 Tax=Piloderma croceum (strain F 1598) TaxID=765440 RepID=A0A0C3BAL7_PILCF|nr:hypothetical protein PILCRDRAFT_819586 [Piloderma croceum F 1598]
MSKRRIKASSTPYHVAQNDGVGILSMPHELLLEITHYLGPLIGHTVDTRIGGGRFLGSRQPYRMNTERRQTLLSLSQCCRFLRSFFLPLAWECFDIHSPKFGNYGHEARNTHQDIAKNLELKSKALAENPELGAHVRAINILIVKLSVVTALPAFAKCLQSLPNLHTLQIAGVYGQIATAIKTVFKGYCFSKIRTVILPPIAHHILGSCPQITDITCTGYLENYFIRTIARRCKMVEALDIPIYSSENMDLIAKAMPNLRRISIRLGYLEHVWIGVLEALPGLHTISLREEHDIWSFLEYDPEARFQPLIQAAVNVLKKHEGDENGKKWVRVWYKTKCGTEVKLWTKDVEVEA